MAVDIGEKLYTTKFRVDEESHLVIKDDANCIRCVRKQCVNCCPAGVYSLKEDGTITVAHSGCLECGTCRVVCDEFNNIEWRYPVGGFGVIYRCG